MNQSFDNLPYVSSDYITENFHPNQLRIQQETIRADETIHHKNEVEFIYVCSGSGSILINGNLFSITTGDLLFLQPYHVNALRLQPGQVLTIYRITFSLGLLLLISTNRQEYLAAIKQVEDARPILSLAKPQRKQVLFLCNEIYIEKQQNHEMNNNLNVSLVAFLSYIFQHYHQKLAQARQPRNLAWEILEFIQVYYRSPLTVATLAEKLQLKPQLVKKILYQLTGASFQENLNRTRIRNAVALLQFEELSSNQIGKICGYQTEANFYKAFKRLLGVTPAVYRQEQISYNSSQTRMDAWEIYLYIQENYRRNVTLKKAAEELNVSEKKINQLLQETFAKNFKEILLSIRLQIGKNLLTSVDKTIKEISYTIGFQEVALFSRHFKKCYGLTPKQYALKYKKEHYSNIHVSN
jgi:AraC-like DNA-binding protein